MDASTQATSSNFSATKYRSFVLTLWSESTGEDSWRCAVQDGHTQTRIGFATFAEMVAYLQKQLVIVEEEL